MHVAVLLLEEATNAELFDCADALTHAIQVRLPDHGMPKYRVAWLGVQALERQETAIKCSPRAF